MREVLPVIDADVEKSMLAELQLELTKAVEGALRVPMTGQGHQLLLACVNDVLAKYNLGPRGRWIAYTEAVDESDPIAVRDRNDRRRRGIAEPIWVKWEDE